MRMTLDYARRRPVTVVVAVVVVVVVVGVLLEGWDFLTSPLPLGEMASRVWFTTNWILAVYSFYLLKRNLTQYEDRWDWQELAVARGVLLILLGALLGYIARTFTDPAITLGTPLTTAGLLLIIQGALRAPERFEEGLRGER